MKKYFEIAFKEALKANKKGEIPVGAVIVYKNKVIAKAHNNRQLKCNVLGHAEINAILKAEKRLKDWRLDNCVMYVTLFPCNMCKTIIEESRVEQVYYLLDNNKYFNNNRQKYTQTNDCKKLKDNYLHLLQNFFQKMR